MEETEKMEVKGNKEEWKGYSDPGAKNIFKHVITCGPGNVVGIATGYGLDGPGIESR